MGPSRRKRCGKLAEDDKRAARRIGVPKEGAELQDDDDAADAGHETRNDRKRHHVNEPAESQHAEHDLKGAAQDNDGEGHADIMRVFDQDRGHHHGHRSGGSRNLGRRTAEKGREQPDGNGAIETGDRARAGRNTKGQRQRQRHDRRRDATEDVAAQIVEAQAVDEGHSRRSLEGDRRASRCRI